VNDNMVGVCASRCVRIMDDCPYLVGIVVLCWVGSHFLLNLHLLRPVSHWDSGLSHYHLLPDMHMCVRS
jgi:hypothetical protein